MGFARHRSRYYVFTRINPTKKDYDRLINVCRKHDIHLVYQTNKINDKKYALIGFLILRLGQSTALRMHPLLPNFFLGVLPAHFDTGYDWINEFPGIPSGPYFHDQKGHPFHVLKKNLDAFKYDPVK